MNSNSQVQNDNLKRVNAVISLRSGKQVDNNICDISDDALNPSSSTSIPSSPAITSEEKSNSEPATDNSEKSSEKEANETDKNKSVPTVSDQTYKPKAPFPHRLTKKKDEGQFEKIRETFSQVKINIPLLDAINQMPPYAKFLKELCTTKRATNVPKKAFLASNVSSIISNQIPVKYKDPGCPTISIVIGDKTIHRALLDLGASVNLLPLVVYEQLGLGELKPTKVTLQLADKSVKVPKGVVEDVLIKVGEFIFPVDFVVLETEYIPNPENQIPVVLGRPFLATSNALINCRNGMMKISFGNMTVDLNIFNLFKQPSDEEYYDTVNWLHAYPTGVDDVESVHIKSSDSDYETLLFAGSTESESSILSSLPAAPESTPSLELKPLPESLKYAFLGQDHSCPVIIASDLDDLQETKLMEMLKKYKNAIGWSLSDIKGISPSIVQHKIHLEENAKSHRDHQRRLNPTLQEVVKKEVIKWLDHGIIYPISDSEWVSPVQVVPKKTGITVVKNDKNELVPTRVQSGWRVCIDYRKLNAATRKNHFPLPFMDQMLERLAGHSYYCFLDGYSGYTQVSIAPEDQDKTTFTCPFGTYAFRKMPFGLCNAPATFQRCMISLFSDMIEQCIEIFMDDFYVFGNSFENCLANLSKVLERCIEKNLVLN